jgi:MSHA biogenesis protein MshN
VPARQALALALFQQHQNAEAEALLAEGLALQPQQASLAMLLSRFKLDHQDLTGAIEVLKNALPSEGGSAEARGLLAAQLQRANQHGEAAEQFALALRQNPSHGVWWMGLGISLAADGRNAAAREAFQRARYASGLSAELQSYVEQRLKGL